MAHILLLEPDRLLAKSYMGALKGEGHTVQVCATAQTAIFCADAQLPDLIIMELQLVGHSGIEFLYELRSYPDWQKIPAVIVTGVPAGEFNDSWPLMRNELGVSGYFYKPLVSLRTLLRAVRDTLPVYT